MGTILTKTHETGATRAEELNAKKVEKTLTDDVVREGELENEKHSMEASIKPNYNIEDRYPEQIVAKSIEDAQDNEVSERIEVGTDASGHQYARVEENVEGQD